MSESTSGITTHVLDTALGRPAAGVGVRLERVESGSGVVLAEERTDEDGRIRTLGPTAEALEPGTYRLIFDLADYAQRTGQPTFFPEAVVTFALVADMTGPGTHHHVPLLVSPFAYSTYRGS